MRCNLWGRSCARPRRAAFCALILWIVVGSPATAGGSGAFSLDWKTELLVSVPAAGLFAAGRVLTAAGPERDAPFGWFDEEAAPAYDGTLDAVGDAACLAPALFLPLLLDRFDLESAAVVGVMYLESAAMTVGAKDALKGTVRRPRPYVFREGTPQELLEDEDRFFSFPSGHTAFAFMTASFATYVFAQGDSSPGTKWAVGCGAFGIASLAGALRVAAGVHHPTDVAVGAVVGALSGFAVPWFHRSAPENLTLHAGAGGVSVSIAY